MPESEAHKRAKAKAAGTAGKRAARKDTAIEVERSGKLKSAARRLKNSGKAKKVLQVPLKDMAKAREALRNAGIGGTVKNMSGSKVSRVPKPK